MHKLAPRILKHRLQIAATHTHVEQIFQYLSILLMVISTKKKRKWSTHLDSLRKLVLELVLVPLIQKQEPRCLPWFIIYTEKIYISAHEKYHLITTQHRTTSVAVTKPREKWLRRLPGLFLS
jgi:hypothetical protein